MLPPLAWSEGQREIKCGYTVSVDLQQDERWTKALYAQARGTDLVSDRKEHKTD